jgi:cystathionine beta-synthase
MQQEGDRLLLLRRLLVDDILADVRNCYEGYKTIITLPEKMSPEKVAVLRALRATIIRTPTEATSDSPESHIGVAQRLQKEIPNAHILNQYGNPENPRAHEYGTAEEIWRQVQALGPEAGDGGRGRLRAVVAGAGTGGTVTGLARGLRRHDPHITLVGADPQGSVLAWPPSLNAARVNEPYKVEGIGYDFVPDVLDQHVVDKWYKTDDRETFAFARQLIAEEGLLVGGSSGSAMAAAVRAAKDLDLKRGDIMVVILPDSIRSYLSKVRSYFLFLYIRPLPPPSNHFASPSPPLYPRLKVNASSKNCSADSLSNRTVRRRRLARRKQSPTRRTSPATNVIAAPN